jgi:hypothetical protein
MCAYPMNADHIAAQDGGFEPQRVNSYAVEFYGVPGVETLSLAIATATLPSMGNEPVEIPFRNEKRFFAGQVTVEDFPISFRDYVDAPIHAAVLTWRRLVYDPATGRVGRAAEYKKRGKLLLLSPDGEMQRTWTLVGVWPQNDPPMNLDSGSSEQLMLEVTFKVDKLIPGVENYIQ